MMQTKPKLFFTFLTILFLGGLFSISYYALTQRQEVRQKAATPEGAATLILSPSAQEFSVGKTESIKVTANAADSSIDGYQVVAKISGSIPPDLTFVPAENSAVQIEKSEITDSDTGDKVLTVTAVTKNPQQPISKNTGLVSIGELRFTPASTGNFSVSFDQTHTSVTRKRRPGKDILNLPTNTTFTVVDSTCTLRPICLDTPGSKCDIPEPVGGWCPPKPTLTPIPVNDCAGRQDGTSCVLGTVCAVCPPGSTTCPKFPCYQQPGVCRNQNCGPLVSPTPTPICVTLPPCLNYNPPCTISIPPLPPGSQYCPKLTPTPTQIGNLPDLQISKISKNITNTVSGQQLVVTICNLGSGFTDQFNVDLYGPNTNTDRWSFSSQGYSTNYCAPVSLSCSVMGNVCNWSSMTALVDPENKIIESNENNNKFFTLFSTPTPTPMPVNTAPQIRNRSLPEGWVRTQYSAEVIATDPDPGDIVTITASGLPDRLRLTCNAGRRSILPNTQTMCRIEGEPTKRGTFDVRILARDSRGASTRRTFSLTILRRKAPLPALQPLFDRLPF